MENLYNKGAEMKIDYEKPELLEAVFGMFAAGDSPLPGGDTGGKGEEDEDL